jgi:MoaA/NifB/PqqE/SkfB family radical SAM enzyme
MNAFTTISAMLPESLKEKLRPTVYRWRHYTSHSRFKSAEAPRPKHLELAATFKCRAYCPHCYLLQEKPDVFKGGPMMPEEMFESIINSDAAQELTSMGCTGGEALLHPKLFDWIETAKAKGVRDIQIVSNGTSLQDEEIVQRILSRTGPTNLLISMDAHTENDYLAAKGIKKTNFDLMLDNIRRVARDARERGDKIVGVSFVIGESNIGKVEDMLNLAESLEVHFCHFTTLQLTDDSHAEELGKSLDSMPTPYQNIMARTNHQLHVTIQPPIEAVSLRYWCGSLDTHLAVSPLGELAPCCHLPWDTAYGEYDPAIENPINNPKIREMRQMFIDAAEKDDPALLPHPCKACNRRLSGNYQFRPEWGKWKFIYY